MARHLPGNKLGRRSIRTLQVGLGVALAFLAILKLSGTSKDFFLPAPLLGSVAIAELLLGVLVMVDRYSVMALRCIAAMAVVWVAISSFVIPSKSSCGCLGGIAWLESYRAAIAMVIGLCSIWALYWMSPRKSIGLIVN